MKKCNESEIRNDRDEINSKISSIATLELNSSNIANEDLTNNIDWNTTGGKEITQSIQSKIDNISDCMYKLIRCMNDLSKMRVDYKRNYYRSERRTEIK